MKRILRLDEASIELKPRNWANQTVDIYSRLNECFGCSPKLLTSLAPPVSRDFIVQTKHPFHLELWNSKLNRKLCDLDNLDLTSQSHYELDIKGEDSSSVCTLNLLQEGECSFCPIAFVSCIILIAIALEKGLSLLARSRFENQSPECKSTGADELSKRSQTGEEDEVVQRLEEVIAQSEGRDGPADRTKRVEALDVFRGIAITGMIMVNNGGAGYRALEHKVWDGLALADLVFPFFIFSMGASIAISSRSVSKEAKPFIGKLYKVLRRSFILFALGICLNSRWLDDRGLEYLRITGVLQRFAVSYMVVASARLIEITLETWTNAQSLCRVPFLSRIMGSIFELLAAIKCILIYIYASFYFQYDATCPLGYLGPGGQTEGGAHINCTGGAAGWIDRELLGPNHLYDDPDLKTTFGAVLTSDPEGILGYTMSILLTLIGLQAGKIIIYHSDNKTRLFLFLASTIGLGLSSSLVVAIPINKHLWSITFVTFTGLLAYLLLIFFFVSLDVYKCYKILMIRLLISAGKNSILLYVGHSVFTRMLPWYFQVDNFSRLQVFLRLCWTTFVWLLVAHQLALKNIFVRV